MPIEYEHRYLVQHIPDSLTEPQHIEQTYIAIDRERNLIQRVRKICTDSKGPEYVATHKIGRDPLVQEVEYPIPAEAYHEFITFFKICHTINKVRYHVFIDGNRWDVDHFSNGMVIAEIENPPEEYSLEGFGKAVNISDMIEFKNFFMSMNGYPCYKHLFDQE